MVNIGEGGMHAEQYFHNKLCRIIWLFELCACISVIKKFNILSMETKKLENEFPSPILTEEKKDLTRKSSTNSRLC